jgi:hypothetical protein
VLLGHEHGVHVPAARVVAEALDELLLGDPCVVAASGLGREPATVAAHDLVDDEHAGVRGVLGDDVLRVDRALLGGRPRPERLADRHDVVVDRLGQPDDGQLVVVLVQVGREVGCRGVRVVATDGVQHVDTVLGELLGRHVQRVLALLHQTALDAVGDVGQLDAGVADRRTAAQVEQVRVLADLRRHLDPRPRSNPAYPPR